MDMGVFKISGIQIISLGTAVVLMVLLTVMLNRTKVGKAIRATSENAETAGLLGINTGRIITLTVMLASALGAAAGVLIGLSFNAIEPTMGTSMGLKGLAVLIMGGLGNVEGAMAGGFILGIAEVFSVAYGTSSYRDAVAFGLIILILFIRPEGLLRKRGREEGRNGRFAEWIFSAGSHLCLHQYYSCHDDLHDALHGHPFFGNAGLMSFGAYTSAILTAQYHVPMPVGIFLGGVMAVLVALVIGLPTIRLRGCIWRLPRWGSVKWSESSP